MNRGGEPAKIALGLLKLTVPDRVGLRLSSHRSAGCQLSGAVTIGPYRTPGSERILIPSLIATFDPRSAIMAESTEKKTVAERVADLSDEVLERLEARQLAAIEALGTLVDRLDDAMPNLVDDPALRKKVLEAIGDYYEQLVTTTNEFLRRVVRGERRMVPRPGDAQDLYEFLRSIAPGGRERVSEQDDAKPAASK